MKALLRAVFIGLVVLTLAAQAARIVTEPAMEQASGLDAGFAALGLQLVAPALPGTLAALAPDCAEPLTLATVDRNGHGYGTARALLDWPGEPRFVYLGFVGAHANAVSIALRWAAASFLRLVGLRQLPVPRDVVLVMLPASCPRLPELDWSALSPWN